MDFLLGVFVGAFTVGGLVFAKVMAAKAEAVAGSNDYLTGKGRVPDEMEQSVIDGWQERARRGF